MSKYLFNAILNFIKRDPVAAGIPLCSHAKFIPECFDQGRSGSPPYRSAPFKKLRIALFLIGTLISLFLSACGQSGKLYLPEQSKQVSQHK